MFKWWKVTDSICFLHAEKRFYIYLKNFSILFMFLIKPMMWEINCSLRIFVNLYISVQLFVRVFCFWDEAVENKVHKFFSTDFLKVEKLSCL